MRWRQSWRRAALAVLLLGPQYELARGSSLLASAKGWSPRRKLDTRDKTRDLWYHGYNNYMRYAFPLDELMPLSCTGKGPDWENPHNYAANDVAGNFSLTLIDVLDTFIVLNDKPAFDKAVRNVIEWVSFDVNTKPQVFETTIRVLGGLLSAHIFASDPNHPFYLPWYNRQLLDMGHDLGRRILPAFSTPTGIPYARLNLKYGVRPGESIETCTAGAGSLILEFGTLSRLTGDDRFEKAAFKAFFALWNRKSDIGLVGNTINIFNGKWLNPEVTGIGAGTDSFFEYALKWYVLSGEVEYLDVWHEAYAAIMRYARGTDGFWFRSVNMHTGAAAYNTVDSLSAFWPGLQVLAGDIENAIKSHLIYWNLWKRNSGLPEVWDISYKQATSTQYPLRPEFAESTYYLYRATGDPFYLDVGERVLYDLILRAKVDCGLCGIADLKTNKREDRMESFVLSETLKYLYLLFDEGNALHKDSSNFVFSTEGHILILGRKHLRPISAVRRKLRRSENLQCPAYHPVHHGSVDRDGQNGLVGGIQARSDSEYARVLVGYVPSESEELGWSQDRICDVPAPELYSYDFILSPNGMAVEEDLRPGPGKLVQVDDGFVLQNVTGIRTHIVLRLDGKGYDIVKLGPHAVRRGQVIYVNDSALAVTAVPTRHSKHDADFGNRSPSIRLRFYLNSLEPIVYLPGEPSTPVDMIAVAFTSSFGGDATQHSPNAGPLKFGSRPGMLVTRSPSNSFGCEHFDPGTIVEDSMVAVHRGQCTFIEKLLNAATGGAAGVIVISDDDIPLNPSASQEDISAAGTILDDKVAVVVTKTTGNNILQMMDAADMHGFADLLVSVEPEGHSGTAEAEGTSRVRDKARDLPADQHRILYLNGHPLFNTRLLI